MRILNLSTYDTLGGAARAALRLHVGLTRLDVQSTMLVTNRTCEEPNVVGLRLRTDIVSRVYRQVAARVIPANLSKWRRGLPNGAELFSDDRSSFVRDLMPGLPETDIVNLHWVAGFLDYQQFFEHVSPRVPLVWTLHDMNPFTGGCHYSGECGGYQGHCGHCPQLGSPAANDLSMRVWTRKQAAFAKLAPSRLHLVAPSKWLALKAVSSSLLGRFKVSVIPNGINTEVFAPRDKRLARDLFGIPEDRTVVLFVSDSLNNHRKGFQILLQALQELPRTDNTLLVSVGGGSSQVQNSERMIRLGRLSDDVALSLAYSAADVFIIPSLEDNLPNTVLEALACGTPVVGFDVGGMPDMIRSGWNGLLVPPGDVESLCAAIRSLTQEPIRRLAMSAAARATALSTFTLTHQAKAYLSLYQEMLGGAKSA